MNFTLDPDCDPNLIANMAFDLAKSFAMNPAIGQLLDADLEKIVRASIRLSVGMNNELTRTIHEARMNRGAVPPHPSMQDLPGERKPDGNNSDLH